MLEELIDRFGEPPKSVQNLLTIARLKSLAHSAYIKEVIQKEDSLKLVMYEHAKVDAARIPELVQANAPALKFVADAKGPYFTYLLKVNSRQAANDVLDTLRRLLEQMKTVLCTENAESSC